MLDASAVSPSLTIQMFDVAVCAIFAIMAAARAWIPSVLVIWTFVDVDGLLFVFPVIFLFCELKRSSFKLYIVLFYQRWLSLSIRFDPIRPLIRVQVFSPVTLRVYKTERLG